MAPATLSESEALSGIDLSSLPTQKIYNEINKEYGDLSNYNTHCENVRWTKNDDQVKGICKKYLRYLEKYPLWYISKPQYDVCRLLNYWIYDKLNEIIKTENTSHDINVAFSTLQYIWKYTVNDRYIRTYYKNCEPDFNIVKHPDWEKRKELYEYYIDYPTIKGLSDIEVSNCKSYYVYIEKKQELYDHFEEKCKSSEYSCPEFYSKTKNYIPKEVLPKLQCHSQISAESAAAAAKADKKESSSHHPLGDAGRSPGPGGGHELGRAPASSYAEQSPESSFIGKIVAHTVLGAAPVFLTATALYRYTPLGPWIRRFGGGRTNTMNAMETFSPYTPETGDMFSDESANYISYQPM
ncbi:PIR protein [Plasmodium vivax]|nr:PIR protein [Plasmodium vivax]